MFIKNKLAIIKTRNVVDSVSAESTAITPFTTEDTPPNKVFPMYLRKNGRVLKVMYEENFSGNNESEDMVNTWLSAYVQQNYPRGPLM